MAELSHSCLAMGHCSFLLIFFTKFLHKFSLILSALFQVYWKNQQQRKASLGEKIKIEAGYFYMELLVLKTFLPLPCFSLPCFHAICILLTLLQLCPGLWYSFSEWEELSMQGVLDSCICKNIYYRDVATEDFIFLFAFKLPYVWMLLNTIRNQTWAAYAFEIPTEF